MAKKIKDFKIVRKSKKVEFWYKGEFFIYEYHSDSSSGFAFIFQGQNKIYGPYERDCTDEGCEVYDVISKKLRSKKK